MLAEVIFSHKPMTRSPAPYESAKEAPIPNMAFLMTSEFRKSVE
jgi:hypothetical protein